MTTIKKKLLGTTRLPMSEQIGAFTLGAATAAAIGFCVIAVSWEVLGPYPSVWIAFICWLSLILMVGAITLRYYRHLFPARASRYKQWYEACEEAASLGERVRELNDDSQSD